jgi:hypothetical protein
MTASSRLKEQPMSDEKPMGQVIQIDEARIRDHLGDMVRGTVEETLNAALEPAWSGPFQTVNHVSIWLQHGCVTSPVRYGPGC